MSNDKQTVFQIRIQSELKEAFKAECLRQYKTPSDVLRGLMFEWLQKQKEQEQQELTSKELAKELIERIPESKMYYILAFLQGAAIPDEATNREILEAIEELESGKGECFEGLTKDFFANMYVVDGIAYAGDPKPMLKVVAVRALADWKLWLKFKVQFCYHKT